MVPIVPVQRHWKKDGIACSRKGFPLCLAWSLTVHKCQGLELPKVKINLGSREMVAGISFVALSRVRRLKDVLFSPHFPFGRLSRIARMAGIQQRIVEEDRFKSMPLYV